MVLKNDIFTPNLHLSALIFELTTSILVLIIALLIFKKWRERKTKATLFLSIALFSISIAALFAFSGLFGWLISWVLNGFSETYSPLYYQFSLPLGYLFVIPYDLFLALFTIWIFLDKKYKKIIPFLIAGIIIGALLFLPTNYWGVDPEATTDPTSTRIIIMGLFLLYNVVVYIFLAFYAFRESRKTEDKVYRTGFRVIALGQIANIIVFVFFLLDSILILFNPGSPGYSIFIDLAWITAIIASFLFYLGFILPNWFRKIIKSEDKPKPA
ncbi:MAG: hypothetical protein EU547_06715 [Promethearchaeota archaeon]|nr:MAG: hypothetical protein EU547_06715 [Candidatus Lokiarchaeota archaeon]